MKELKLRKVLTVLLSVVLLVSLAVAAVSCKQDSEPTKGSAGTSTEAPGTTKAPETTEAPKTTKEADPATEPAETEPPVTEPAEPETFSVTLDLNYEGAPEAEVLSVTEGEKAERPADPARDSFAFTGWFTDKEGTASYDFASAVTEDVVLYAGWLEEEEGVCRVTFDLNYEGAPEPTVVTVESGEKVAEPKKTNKLVYLTSPDGLYKYDYETASFLGWYTEASCENEFDFNTEITKSTTLYAKWGPSTYAFEAELTDLTGKTGFGYSISFNDEGIIRYDSPERNQSARLGFSVGYLYSEDLSIEFLIYSDRDVDNVTLKARLSAEFRDIYIAPKQVNHNGETYYSFMFLVNDESMDYEPIALTGAKAQMTPNQRPYDNWTISTEVSLKEGLNEIVLLVANSHEFESTINAVAPMVDTIFLTADANLTWEPKWSNLNNVHYEDD